MQCWYFNIRYALQLILNMTQNVSHWFYTLDLNNQTFLIKFLEILAFNSFLYHRPEGVCLYVRCLSDNWTWTTTRKSPQERQFSHMGNSVWLHWGTREYLNKQCIYCTLSWVMVYLPMISHSIVQLAAAVHVTSIVDHHGKPGGSRNYYSKRKENISHECLWTVNNVDTFLYEPHSGVTWGKSVLCCVSDLVVFPAALRSYLRGPLEGSLSNGSTWPWPMTVTYRGSQFLTHCCD